MRITGGKGVDVVYDPVGMLIPSLKCVNWGARLVVVGFAAGPIEKVPANLLLLKSVSIVGLFWGATFGMSRLPSTSLVETSTDKLGKDPQRAQQVIKEVLQLLGSGKILPAIYEPVYEGLEQVGKGLDDLDKRKTWGRAVVRVRKGDGDGKAKAKL
jgi:NADPH2:quinone reductase